MSSKLSLAELDDVLASAGACSAKRKVVVELYEKKGFDAAYRTLIKAAFWPRLRSTDDDLLGGMIWYRFEIRDVLYALMVQRLSRRFGNFPSFLPEDEYKKFLRQRDRFYSELHRYQSRTRFLKQFPPRRVKRLIMQAVRQ